MAKGIVYIVRNPAFPHLIKIGFTTKGTVEDRGLNASNVPEDYDVLYAYKCDNPQEIEAHMHDTFKSLRHYTASGRQTEFFYVGCVPQAKKTLELLTKAQNIATDLQGDIEEQRAEAEAEAEGKGDKELFDKDKILTLSRSQEGRYKFWTQLNEYINISGAKIKTRNPNYDHWYDFAIGGSGNYHLSVNLLDRKNKIRILLWIVDDKAIYDKVFAHKGELEQKLGPLEWDRKNDAKASWVAGYIDGFSFDDAGNWKNLFPQIVKKVSDFAAALKPILK